MRVADVIAGGAVLLVLLLFCAVVARQRFMLRTPGALPVALRRGSHRWTYGIARFVGNELRWYRAWGIGTRATLNLRRPHLRILHHRRPEPAELGSLPETARIVECQVDGGATWMLAFNESAFTGFVSWLEAAPRS